VFFSSTSADQASSAIYHVLETIGRRINKQYKLEAVLKVGYDQGNIEQFNNILTCYKMSFFYKIKDATHVNGPKQFFHKGSNKICFFCKYRQNQYIQQGCA